MNNNSDRVSLTFVAFLCFLSLVCGTIVGFWNGLNGERASAIKAGVAEYTVNPKTGEVQFVYKSDKK